jgi:hypothetical protein
MGTVPAYEATIELRISGAKVFVDGSIIGYCNNPQRYGTVVPPETEQAKYH